MLEIKNVSHRFDNDWVLQNQNLSLAPGQRLAVMGPSGCGKTTLLRIAVGLIRPTAGIVNNMFSSETVVFQEPRLLPWRTAQENVNLVLGDGKQTMERAAHWLNKVGLSDARDKLPRELSGGMQQRVALARALAVEGDFLVLDEPFKAMDAALRQQIIDLVKQTRSAILLVTHDAAEAEQLGCDILTMEKHAHHDK